MFAASIPSIVSSCCHLTVGNLGPDRSHREGLGGQSRGGFWARSHLGYSADWTTMKLLLTLQFVPCLHTNNETNNETEFFFNLKQTDNYTKTPTIGLYFSFPPAMFDQSHVDTWLLTSFRDSEYGKIAMARTKQTARKSRKSAGWKARMEEKRQKKQMEKEKVEHFLSQVLWLVRCTDNR